MLDAHFPIFRGRNRLREPQTSPLHNRDVEDGQQGCMKMGIKFDFVLWARLQL